MTRDMRDAISELRDIRIVQNHEVHCLLMHSWILNHSRTRVRETWTIRNRNSRIGIKSTETKYNQASVNARLDQNSRIRIKIHRIKINILRIRILWFKIKIPRIEIRIPPDSRNLGDVCGRGRTGSRGAVEIDSQNQNKNRWNQNQTDRMLRCRVGLRSNHPDDTVGTAQHDWWV